MNPIDRIRFGGIASGMDTEGIIKNLMRTEQMKVDRQFQQKTILEWKRDDYRSVNNSLRTFREQNVFNLKLQGAFLAKKVSSSNEAILTASAGPNTLEGSYSINVIQTAKAASAQSSAKITGEIGSGSFTIQGKDGEEAQATINVNENDTVQIIAAKINEKSSQTGIKAIYDENSGRLFMMSKSTGQDNFIKIVSDDNGILKNLNLYSDDTLPAEGKLLATGANAQIKLNGGETLEFNSNQINLLGLTMTIKQEGNATLTVGKDIDSVVDQIKSFVEQYNKIMEDLGTKLGEKRYRDFAPLTDEQKADMKEKDIEKWEEKARSGIFRADSLLSSIASNLRMTVGSAVETGSKYKTFSSIGIMTSPDWKDHGKLYIDEKKLREALTDDLDGVAKIFNNESSDPKAAGIARKLDDMLKGQMESIASTAGRNVIGADESYLGKEISRMNKSYEEMQKRLIRIEENYWAKFTAMEKAYQQMQNQSAWLAGQLGQMQR
ncbi:Flagellin hook, IN motif [Syntrophomonas zehnderi OL-4]|uniref:Flagellar hook-associated protein 2 n=1 Tax=Syntrophomonas zehnderi OL-4 TaxID=690567 RepID=A0A0E4GCE6_9FIRM|nr:flagellar filament capping protein FliD [Syntrophomonas zehnderi]CFX12566.1 Flagellin hook, IN motif [Syntrophomonas zehnderi OL-4]